MTPTSNAVEALVFDVDGVIILGRRDDGRHWSSGLEADLGIKVADLQRGLFETHWADIIVGRASLYDHLPALLQKIAPAVTCDDFLRYWFQKDSLLNRHLLSEIDEIRLSGRKTYLLTNQEHCRAKYLLNELGLARHFDGMYYSAALGHRKPETKAFEVVAAGLQLQPEHILLIDDTPENVDGAQRAGWQASLWKDGMLLSDLLQQVPNGGLRQTE